jgi:hypothetical protein
MNKSLLLPILFALSACSADPSKNPRVTDAGVPNCTMNSQCGSGQCLQSPKSANKFCAAVDPGCASFLRWSMTAGDSLGGMCVTMPDLGPIADFSILYDLYGFTDMTVLGCSALTQCINDCDTNMCRSGCFNDASAAARTEYTALAMCLIKACPSATPADVCYTVTNACQACYNDAQFGGTCQNQSDTCSNN